MKSRSYEVFSSSPPFAFFCFRLYLFTYFLFLYTFFVFKIMWKWTCWTEFTEVIVLKTKNMVVLRKWLFQTANFPITFYLTGCQSLIAYVVYILFLKQWIFRLVIRLKHAVDEHKIGSHIFHKNKHLMKFVSNLSNLEIMSIFSLKSYFFLQILSL